MKKQVRLRLNLDQNVINMALANCGETELSRLIETLLKREAVGGVCLGEQSDVRERTKEQRVKEVGSLG